MGHLPIIRGRVVALSSILRPSMMLPGFPLSVPRDSVAAFATPLLAGTKWIGKSEPAASKPTSWPKMVKFQSLLRSPHSLLDCTS